MALDIDPLRFEDQAAGSAAKLQGQGWKDCAAR
jgi:hypothetical protein